jgi:predicted 2-oxoglutarate/Fe(II)-dependent dioxygenase YbiX
MNNDLNHITLYPKIEIYKGLLPEAKDFAKDLKLSEKDSDGKFYLKKWDQWSVFGTYTQAKTDLDKAEFGLRYDREKYISDSISDAYSKAIKHYIDKHNLTLPKGSYLMTSSFSKYNPTEEDAVDGLAMQYHTDYITVEKDMPGPKFFLTCTTYLNDDYEGGDIVFYIDGEDVVYPYKPQAGDICVFPSTEPYFHGVKAIKNGEKFFVRNFISYTYEGSKEWLDNQKNYGAYRWAKMEEARIEREDDSAVRHIEYDILTNKIRRKK